MSRTAESVRSWTEVPENVRKAIRTLHPFAVDVSSGIESKKVKDRGKMTAFAAAVRKEGTP